MKKIISLVLVSLLVLTLAACGQKDDGANTVFGIDDLPGKKIGVQLGTTGDIFASDYEDEGSSVERFKKGADAVLALKQGKIDCVIIDDEPAKVYVAENDDLMILDEPFAVESYAAAVKKGNDSLLKDINDALKTITENGTLQKIKDNYIGVNAGETPYVVSGDVARQGGKLIVGTNAEFPPYEYMDGDKIVGLDMDIAQAICDVLGLELEIVNMDFDSILSAVESGKVDVALAAMTMTEERIQSVDFSDSYTTATQVIIVRK